MTSEFENARRTVARECLKELRKLPKHECDEVTHWCYMDGVPAPVAKKKQK
ncbi:hypothetical protein ABLA76_15060 [Xenorhabdus sp. SGI240]